MAARRIHAPALDYGALLNALVTEIPLTVEFSTAALRAAELAASAPQIPQTDLTHLPFVTIDPPGSRDLDQAMLLSKGSTGYVVRYAIADVAAFVDSDSPLATELLDRGQTMYLPDRRVPLHPPSLSEGAASLLPGQARPAVVWTIKLDDSGEVVDIDLGRAMVRSVTQYDYLTVQHAITTNDVPKPLAALPDIGELLLARARQRGALDLRLPEQEVQATHQGWRLAFRAPLPVEGYNAQISLLTGECAATIMLNAGVGVLRTLPPPTADTVARLARAAPSLGVSWPPGASPNQVIDHIDAATPKGAAFLDLAAILLRGAGYTVVPGSAALASKAKMATTVTAQELLHAGVGAPYAHVTAPLRRLVDKYGTEVCLAITAGQSIPEWVSRMLPQLPELMSSSDRKANQVERAVLDYTEAVILAKHVGEEFDAAVVDTNDDRDTATIVIDEPAVRARCRGEGLKPGQRIRARLIEADPANRRVQFEAAN